MKNSEQQFRATDYIFAWLLQFKSFVLFVFLAKKQQQMVIVVFTNKVHKKRAVENILLWV